MNSNSLKKQFFNQDTLLCSIFFFAALAIRIVYLNQIKTNPFFVPRSMDPLFYHQWALRIAHGEWVGNTIFEGMPLYAYFLGVIYKIFGESVYVARLIQIIFGALSCSFIYLLGKKLFSETTGIIAAILAVFYKPFIFYDAVLVGDSLAVFLFLIVIFLSFKFFDTLSKKNAFIWGFMTGVAALCRPAILFFPVITAVVYPLKFNPKIRKQVIKSFMWVFIGLFSILAVVAIRNYVVGKDFVLFTAHSGLNFYIGNNPTATGKFHAPPGVGRQREFMLANAHRIAERELGRSLKPSESSAYWKKKAYQFIEHNPEKFIRLLCKKLYLFWQGGEIADFANIDFYKRFSPLLRVPLVSFLLVVPWSILGIVISFKINRNMSLVRYLLFGYLGGTIIYFINSRYRLPVVPLLLIFASYGFLSSIELFKKRKLKETMITVISVILLYGALGIGMEKPNLADDYNELASWYVDVKRDNQRAIALFKEALRYDPNNQYVIFNLARTYFESNNLDESLEAFKRAVELDTTDYESYNFIGIVYSKKGDLEKSVPYFQKAIQINPHFYMAMNNLATNLSLLGNTRDAVFFWKKSLAIHPEQPDLIKRLQ